MCAPLCFHLCLPHLSVVPLALPLQAKREPRPRLTMEGLAFGRLCTESFFSWLCLIWFALLLTALFLMPPFGHVNYFWEFYVFIYE